MDWDYACWTVRHFHYCGRWFINQCQYNLDENKGKYDTMPYGVIIGIASAYAETLKRSGIDNDYAGQTVGEFSNKMCQTALWIRKEENKKTGGKYDVTKFYHQLLQIGYEMTLPPSFGSNTTRKE